MRHLLYLLLPILIIVFSISGLAHCDHIDGPVVLDARIAIEQDDITPVLKWIHKHDEKELKVEAIKGNGPAHHEH